MEGDLAVCSEHFTTEQLSELSRNALKEDVIPSVFSVNHFSTKDYVETDNICAESGSGLIGKIIIKTSLCERFLLMLLCICNS